MAYITKVPTQDVIRRAKKSGKSIGNFIANQTIVLGDNGNGDRRLINKHGVVLEDYMITRDDGTNIIIHEENSEVEGYKKMQLIEVNQDNRITKEYNAYTEGLDYVKMLRDQQYLDCLGNGLLQQSRLNSKEQIANNKGINDAIYIGTIGISSRTGMYEKQSRNEDEVLNYIRNCRNLAIERKNNKATNQRKINTILEMLNKGNIPSSKLDQICGILGINIRDIGHGGYGD